MANIYIAFDQIIKPYEGFYSNVAGDSGGETVYGYARNKNAAAPLWLLVDGYKSKTGFPENMRNDHAVVNLVINLYKLNYWDKLKLDQVNDQRIANEVFDIAVNCGPDTAGKFLQRSINVFNRDQKDYANLTVDGIIGSKTITALNVFANANNVLKALNALQGERYISLCEGCELFEKFMNGWIQRIAFDEKKDCPICNL